MALTAIRLAQFLLLSTQTAALSLSGGTLQQRAAQGAPMPMIAASPFAVGQCFAPRAFDGPSRPLSVVAESARPMTQKVTLTFADLSSRATADILSAAKEAGCKVSVSRLTGLKIVASGTRRTLQLFVQSVANRAHLGSPEIQWQPE